MPTFADALTYRDAPVYGPWPLPAATRDDVWAGFPAWWTDPDDPIRDGLGEALRLVWLRVAGAIARASVLHLRAHARGWALDLVAQGAGYARTDSEDDEALRARLGIIEDVCTSTAIRTALNGILTSVTTCRIWLIEPWQHGAFAGRSFVSRPPIDALAMRAAGRSMVPVAGVTAILFTDVGPVRAWTGNGGGQFMVSLPRLAGLTPAFAGTTVASRTFCAPTTRPVPAGFLALSRPFASSAARRRILRAIAATLSRISPPGVRRRVWLDQPL